MRSLGFASPRSTRQKHSRLNACRRRPVTNTTLPEDAFAHWPGEGRRANSTRSGGAFRRAFWPGATRRCRPAAPGALRSSTPYAMPRFSDSNTARLGRGEQPIDVVCRVSARDQDHDADSEPRDLRPSRRPVHRRHLGAGLDIERPDTRAPPGRRHLRTRKPPGGGSLTARISCVAGEPRPCCPTTHW